MFESTILGIIQGIAEWLPISSEGLLVLVKTNIFGDVSGLKGIIRIALFLHLGTFFAALVYFRKDVFSLIKSFFKYKSADEEHKKILIFLIVATVISGIIGFLFINIFIKLEDQINITPKIITLIIGLLLLITAFLQIKAPSRGYKNSKDLKIKDGVLLGLMQGLAVLPGLSRSGLTVSTLLLRKFDDTQSLRLSFLMSLPIVLFGNIFLNVNDSLFSTEALIGLIFAFVFGILTIHLLLKLAKKINFGYFVLIFAVLTILSLFV